MGKDEKEKKEWKVNLVIIDENQPPKKVLVKGEETLDEWSFRAKVLNELEIIKSAITS